MTEGNVLKPVKIVSYAFSIANFIVWVFLLGVLKIPLVNLVHKLKSRRLFAKLDNKHEMFYQTIKALIQAMIFLICTHLTLFQVFAA